MEEQRLIKDIEDLFGKTNRLDKELVEIKTDQKHYTDALERVAESNARLIDTLKSMEITFVEMSGKINEMSKQVDGIDCRIKKVEETNNFEIMGFLKKYFPWVVVIVGLAAYQLKDSIKF